jgi:O-glycosyl hydrolase
MLRKRHRSRWMGAIALGCLTGIASVGLTALPAAAASNPVTARVDPGIVLVDEFQGFGTSLAWWADVVGGWDEPERSELLDLLFDDSGIALEVVRYNVGASEPGVDYPVVDPHLPERNGAWIESLIDENGNYDWTLDANQRYVLEESIERGATTFELFANSPPWFMTHSGVPSGRYSHNSWQGCQHSNLNPAYTDDFADYMAEVTERFAEVGIDGPGSTTVDFRTIEPFNEPGNGWWCWGNNQEGTYLTAGEQSDIVLELREALDARGMTTEIAATDSNNYWSVVTEFDAMSAAARAEIGQINAHGYAGSDPAPVRSRVEAGDMRFWQSEWGPAGWGGYNITSELDAALELATRVTNDLSYVEANAWLYWQAIEDSSRGEGPGYWGLIQAPLDGSAQTYDVQKQFYTLGQYSKFIRSGMNLIDAGFGKSTAAYDPTSNELVVVTYNDTSESIPLTYDLSRFSLSGATADVYRTSATENLAQLSSVSVSGGSLATTIPANSVVTHVISGATAANNASTSEIVNDGNGWTYSGSWNDVGYNGADQGAYGLWDQDEHSSQSANATASLTFHGTGIDLFGTIAPSSGLMSVSIDGGTAVTVNAHNNVRLDGVRLWSSPNLTAGRHTLQVKILGQAGASGGGTWGNVDRAVVRDSGWTSCGNEGQTCTFSGVAEVRYGARGDYVRGVFAAPVACSNATFGDPTPGSKHCYYRSVATAEVVAAHSQQCAGVSASGTADGTDVLQWPCTAATDQRWNLSKLTSGYRFQPAHATGKCIGVDDGSTAAGARVELQTCSTATSQQWTFTYVDNGYYEVRPAHATGMCLDVTGASQSWGTLIEQYTCNGYDNQLWKLTKP